MGLNMISTQKWYLQSVRAFFLLSLCVSGKSFSDDSQPAEISEKLESKQRVPKRPGNKAFIVSDFLYWEAIQEGIEYAVRSEADSDVDAKIKDIDFDWSPGYRIGFGYIFKESQWDLVLDWTHFHNHSSSSSRPSEPRVLKALWIPADLVSSQVPDASARWHLQYDLVDFSLGCLFYPSKTLSVRPFVGLRFASIHQHIRVRYDDVHLIHSANLFEMVTRGKNAYAGGGFRAGAELNFYLNRHWSFYGAASGSLLGGDFDVKLAYQAPPQDIGKKNLGYRSNENRIRSNWEGALGLQWETGYSEERYHLTFLLCYEWALWPDQNQWLKAFSRQSDGNLTLQGGTLRTVFAF